RVPCRFARRWSIVPGMPTDDRPARPPAWDDEPTGEITGVLVADDHGSPPPDPPEPEEANEERGRPRRSRRGLKLVLAALGALAFGLASGYALHGAGLQVDTTAPADGAYLSASDADDLIFRIKVDLPGLMDTATLEYDGA